MPSMPFASSVAPSGISSTAARKSEAFSEAFRAFLRLPEMARMVVMALRFQRLSPRQNGAKPSRGLAPNRRTFKPRLVAPTPQGACPS